MTGLGVVWSSSVKGSSKTLSVFDGGSGLAGSTSGGCSCSSGAGDGSFRLRLSTLGTSKLWEMAGSIH
ncbi:hypothetical protein HYQ46_012869 [Verticillium longisporum]|nr:hypothetical protein HYQ46_012869 [Verticillium longisporum]